MIDLPSGWKKAQVQAPSPVLTMRGFASGARSEVKIWYSYWLGLGVRKTEVGQVGHGLKDDRLAVGPKIALAGPEEPKGRLADILKVLGLELRHLLGGKRPFGRGLRRRRPPGRIKARKPGIRTSESLRRRCVELHREPDHRRRLEFRRFSDPTSA